MGEQPAELATSIGLRIVHTHMDRAGVIGCWELLADRINAEIAKARATCEAERRVIEAARRWVAGKNGKALISCDDRPLANAVARLQEVEREESDLRLILEISKRGKAI